MLTLIAAATFITVFVVVVGLYYFGTAARREVKMRISRYVAKPPAPAAPRPEQAAAPAMGAWRSLVRQLSRYFESFQWSRWLEHRLMQAGLPLRGSEFLVICTGSALVGMLTLFILARGRPIFAVIGAIIGYLVPLLVLRVKVERRTKAFNDQLGDALILIANSLRTGYSFLQSIEMVSREMLPPIATEFARVLREMNLGVTTEEALNNLAKRVDSDDLDLVVTAVLIQRQVGGNLAEVLENIAGTIRSRIKIKGEIKTLTAQGRISGVIIGLLPVALGLVIYALNPGYMQILFTHPLGRALVAGAVVSQLIGVLLIRRIVNIDV